MTIAYLNGSFLPLSEARVSVLDRGFLFADGVYEVVPVYGGRPFHLQQHLERLDRSLSAILLDNPMSAAEWTDMIERLLILSEAQDQMLYVQVTRGATQSRSHALPSQPTATVLAFCQALPTMSDKVRTQGVSAITLPDSRWQHCDVKSIALLGNVLLANQALNQGCNEALLTRDGRLTEGASSNVFVVRDNIVCTPPKGNELLPGITRDLILSLSQQVGLETCERQIDTDELLSADELWISSSTRELYAVTKLDGQSIGPQAPGPLWAKVYSAFQTFKQQYASNHD